MACVAPSPNPAFQGLVTVVETVPVMEVVWFSEPSETAFPRPANVPVTQTPVK